MIGAAVIETGVLSRYQKLNCRRRHQKQMERMLTNKGKNEQQTNLTCIESSAAKTRIQPKNIRQNHHHQDARLQEITIFQGDTAKHQNSTIVHLLTQKELDMMKEKGAVVVHVTLPVKSYEGKVKQVFWKILHVSSQDDVFAGPCRKNLLIVTTYDQISSSNCICFIGMALHKPMPEIWALLCLVHHQSESRPAFDQNFFNVNITKKQCGQAKYNIVSGKTTGHHRSRGFIFGFGSWRDMRIDKITQSSLAKYSVKKGGNIVNSTLEEQLTKSMESVQDELRRYVGYDILLDNCNSLTVSERYAKKFGISRDFHLLG